MAAKHRPHPIAGFHLFLLILFIGHCVEAQTMANGGSNSSNGSYQSPKFNLSMVIIIVLLVSAFFFLGFFSIYIRHCGVDGNESFAAVTSAAAAAAGLIRIQRGLNPEVLENFPTLVYSEVKEHKIGKGALECAICLNEFEDDETIRLLPECDHVFHLECIDAWLATHVTCPVCRANYTLYSPDSTSRILAPNDGAVLAPVPPEAVLPPEAPPADHVAITVADMDERKEEMRELARIASRVRGNGPKRSKRLPRSRSMGHLMMPEGEGGLDRYTLRLPENFRKEIMAARKLHRAKTFAVNVTAGGAGEASMRKISREAGEGSSRRGRTIHLGRSDRWPSFFSRSLSARISTLRNWRRGEEGCVKEKSISRKSSGVRTSVDSRGGATAGAGESNSNGRDSTKDEASTAVQNRV